MLRAAGSDLPPLFVPARALQDTSYHLACSAADPQHPLHTVALQAKRYAQDGELRAVPPGFRAGVRREHAQFSVQ